MWRRSVLIPVLWVLLFGNVYGDNFEFIPLPASDWLVEPDSANHEGAIILQERIIADEERWIEDRCFYSVYQRIRIFSERGKERSKVTLPYVHRKQNVEEIKGRCILRDGQIIEMEKEHIKEQELVKGKGVRIKQKTFTIPGVTDDCIIEIYYRLRIPDGRQVWTFQRDVPLLDGELRWKFYRGKGIPWGYGSFFSGFLTPNYGTTNWSEVEITTLPEGKKEQKEAIFRVKNVPPMIEEPYSLPNVALRGQVHYYYSSPDEGNDYWLKRVTNINEHITEFSSKSKKAKPVLALWESLPDEKEKILAAYEWVQSNIKNVDYEDDPEDEYKRNLSVDDVLKHSYGRSIDLNLLFIYFLREMKIPARLCYTYDREDDHFFSAVKRWQFTESFVAVAKGGGKYNFYSPGIRILPAGTIPWNYQGAIGLLVGDGTFDMINLPVAAATDNRYRRFLWLSMDEDLQLAGKMMERFEGDFAYYRRAVLVEKNDEERQTWFEEQFGQYYPNGKMDSLEIGDVNAKGTTLDVKYRLALETSTQEAGDRLLIRPVQILSKYDNPFSGEERKHNIVFDMANEEVESVNLELPEGWIVDAIPEQTRVSNIAGTYQLVFQSLNGGRKLSIQRSFKLKHPFLTPAAFPAVKQLFEARKGQEDLTVVLKTAG